MAREKISIQTLSEIRTAASKRQYFTLENPEEKKFVCFITALWEHCKVGSEIDAEVEPREGNDPLLTNIYINDKPVYKAEPKPQGWSKGRSEESYAKERRSIERQTSIKAAIDMSGDTNDIELILERADKIYQWISRTGEEVKTGSKQPIQGAPPAKTTTPHDPIGDAKRRLVTDAKQGLSPDAITFEELEAWAKEKLNWKPTASISSWLQNRIKMSVEDARADPAKAKEIIMKIMTWD